MCRSHPLHNTRLVLLCSCFHSWYNLFKACNYTGTRIVKQSQTSEKETCVKWEQWTWINIIGGTGCESDLFVRMLATQMSPCQLHVRALLQLLLLHCYHQLHFSTSNMMPLQCQALYVSGLNLSNDGFFWTCLVRE